MPPLEEITNEHDTITVGDKLKMKQGSCLNIPILEDVTMHERYMSGLEEDEWKGDTGFIHQVTFDKYLEKHDDPTEVEYYMCGPPPMISASENMLYDLGVEEEMIAYDKFG